VEKILKLSSAVIKEKKEQDGFTGLHLAAFNGNREVVEFLIKQVLRKFDLFGLII
jgi:ankyrin repeat protein